MRDLEDQLNALMEADPEVPAYTAEQLNDFAPPKLKEPNPNKPAKKPNDPNRKPTKSELAAWNPRRVPMKFDWIPSTREKKARTRIDAFTVTELKAADGTISWQVGQMETLGDRYETYVVKQNPEGRIACTCQGHAYGDTRMLCTHAIAGILFSYKPDDGFTGEICGTVERTNEQRIELAAPEEAANGRGATETGSSRQISGAEEVFERIEASYGNTLADNGSTSGQILDRGVRLESAPVAVLGIGSGGDSFKQNQPVSGSFITEELIQLVEQANSNGEVFAIDPWEVCYPASYQLTWTVSQVKQQRAGHSAGLQAGGEGLREQTQSLVALSKNLTEAHNLAGFGFDFSTTAPEDILDPSDRESLELIEEYKHRQDVMQRISLCERMPDPSRWALPEHFTSLRDHQWIALQQIVAAWSQGKKYVFLDAPTGCLDADTWIQFSIHNGEGKRISHRGASIQRLFDRFHRIETIRPGHNNILPPDYYFMVASACENTGAIKTRKILDVIDNGEREVFEVKTDTGRTIRATANHPFFINGTYVALENLRVGDKVCVHTNTIPSNGRQKRKPRKYLFVKYHPSERWKAIKDRKTGVVYNYCKVVLARATIEAEMNGLSLSEYTWMLNNGQVPEKLLDDSLEVHHKDFDCQNDSLSNLQVVTTKEHHELHSGHERIIRYTTTEKIVRIHPVGISRVFDLTMEGPPNFVANGFIVHNSGKSIMGCIAFLEWAGVCVGKEEAKGLICVTSKELQDQMHSDFGDSWWFAMIKGRLNYPTANFPERFVRDQISTLDEKGDWRDVKDLWAKHIDCSDCEFSAKKHCRYCDPPGVTGPPREKGGAPCLGRCPYRVQLKKLIRRLLGLVNTAYLLRIANSNAWGQFDDRTLLVADECDTLEGVLMGYVTVEVNEKKLAVLGPKVGRPEYHSPCENAYTDWFGWAGRAKSRIMEILQRRVLQLKGEIPIGDEPGEEKIRITDDQRDLRRDVKQWQLLGENLTILMDSISKNPPDPWIYDGYVTDKETKIDSGDIIFKPVRVNQFGEAKLFGKFKNVLLESATLISADQIARDLGIASDAFAVVSVPRTFDSNRCPVNILPIADNSFKEQANSWPALSDAIQRIVMQNDQHRILVHAVSYVQADKVFQFLRKAFPGRTILTHERGAGSKKAAMERYAKTPGAVLISPSMARGSDLKGDLCRVQIIIKVPFGNLGDKQINARLHGTHDGQLWYSTQTIREIVQMTGRGMRSADDWCETWILDKQFLSVWGQYQMLFPSWWRESVRFIQAGGRR